MNQRELDDLFRPAGALGGPLRFLNKQIQKNKGNLVRLIRKIPLQTAFPTKPVKKRKKIFRAPPGVKAVGEIKGIKDFAPYSRLRK